MQVILSEEEWKQVLNRKEVKRFFDEVKKRHDEMFQADAKNLMSRLTANEITYGGISRATILEGAKVPDVIRERLMEKHKPLIDALRELSKLVDGV